MHGGGEQKTVETVSFENFVSLTKIVQAMMCMQEAKGKEKPSFLSFQNESEVQENPSENRMGEVVFILLGRDSSEEFRK